MSQSALTPAFTDELQRERLALVAAERHLLAGNGRLQRQQELVENLRQGGGDHPNALRYLTLLAGTMRQWERHHQLIVERLLYLERHCGTPG